MLDSLLLVLLGAFVGWHFPEPSWAKAIKAKIVDLIERSKLED